MITTVVAVAVGGALGTLARFFTGNWITANWPQHFYGATLIVNLVGCLLIGVLYGLFLMRPEVPLERLWHAVPSYPTTSEVWLRLLEAYGL